MKAFCCLILCATSLSLMGQFPSAVQNPSFEGDLPLQIGIIPAPWQNSCVPFSTPDIQPGFWGVTTPPKDGYSYIQLVCRSDGSNEGITQFRELTDNTDQFNPNATYYFQIWLCSFNAETYNYKQPAKLQVWLVASYSCLVKYLAWESPAISHADWRPYFVEFKVPPGYNYDYFQLESAQGSEQAANGNVMFDAMSDSIYKGIPPRLGQDTTICMGDTLLLQVPDSCGQALWSDGSLGNSFPVTAPGRYWADITLHGITYRDEIRVRTAPVPKAELSRDTLLCLGETLLLEVDSTESYVWQDFSTERTYTVTTPGTYWIEVRQGICSASDTIDIAYRDCETILRMPNVFSPNGDGNNDLFEPMEVKNVYQPQITCFDRWGRRVYQSYDLLGGWDGTLQGKALPAGVYLYVIEYQNILGTSMQRKGTITLMR